MRVHTASGAGNYEYASKSGINEGNLILHVISGMARAEDRVSKVDG
jgi:hypothetical protein